MICELRFILDVKSVGLRNLQEMNLWGTVGENWIAHIQIYQTNTCLAKEKNWFGKKGEFYAPKKSFFVPQFVPQKLAT